MSIEQQILNLEKELLTEKDIERLGLFSAATLRNERSKSRNPRLRHVKINRAVRYRKEDVMDYIKKNMVYSDER